VVKCSIHFLGISLTIGWSAKPTGRQQNRKKDRPRLARDGVSRHDVGGPEPIAKVDCTV